MLKRVSFDPKGVSLGLLVVFSFLPLKYKEMTPNNRKAMEGPEKDFIFNVSKFKSKFVSFVLHESVQGDRFSQITKKTH
jgi:hypothetical protein